MHQVFHSIIAFTLICQGAAFLQSNHRQRHAISKLHSVPTALDTLTSGLASIFRVNKNGLVGVTVASNVKAQGGIGLTLYDVENSKDCRLVRELLTELDLVVDIVPVGKGSKHKAPKEAPCLVAAPNGGKETVVSGVADISQFLKKTFSEEASEISTDAVTLQQVFEAITPITLAAAGFLRTGRGASVAPAASASDKVNRPEQKLVLYSYEGNQFCRLVREVLTELDICYELRSAGKTSPRREELAGITGGSTQCPYLVDPNTGTSLVESADIIRHLYTNYASWTPPSEILQWASQSIMPAAKPIFKLTAPLQAGSSADDRSSYDQDLEAAKTAIKEETASAAVIVYTYELSPFSFEVKALLNSLNVDYKEISLGKEWLPGLIAPNGSIKRAALLDMTGQSSLPHIFIGGKPIGGLFSGEPGLIPLLEQDELSAMLEDTMTSA